MMDEEISGNKVNIDGGPKVSVSNENVRRGDYFFLGFIGTLLAGVIVYLVLNPAESTLRSAMETEKGNAHKLVHEPVATHAVIYESAKPEMVKPKAVKPEVVKPEMVKPEAVKPEAVKPEVVKPEMVKPEAVKPEPATVASASGHEKKPQAKSLVWAVNLVSYARLDSASKAIAQLKSEGVEAEFIEVTARGNKYYRVRIPNLASRQEAARLYDAFRNRPEYKGVWIAPYRKSVE